MAMIHVESLVKKFGAVAAVDGVDFGASRGEILGVLGPNGAGKTTTLRILCGYLRATSGRVEVSGLDVAERSLDVRRSIGYLPENNPLYPEMRVAEHLSFRAALKGIARRNRTGEIDRVLGRCGLTEVTKRPIGTLSKGFRQRVGLADALLGSPPLLILDEPTVGLDPNQVIEVRELIRALRGEHTVLLSSHHLPEVEQTCDRVVIFHRGRIIAEDDTAALRDAASVDLVVETTAADGEKLASLLRPLGTLTGPDEIDGGWVRLVLSSRDDLREEIFRIAVASSVTLREITRRRATLEEVFRSLTSSDPLDGDDSGETA